MSSIISKGLKWYFLRRALPFWGLLCLDCAIVMFSGYLAKYLEIGGLNFAQKFWPITHGLLLSIVLFFISFRIFHTYSGVVRYSSFVDLKRIVYTTLSGAFLICISGICIQQIGVAIPFDFHKQSKLTSCGDNS